MKRGKILSFIILLLASNNIINAQTTCMSILNQAEDAHSKGDLSAALRTLQHAEICDYKNTLQKERQQLQNKIFNSMEKQKNEAEKAKQYAEMQTRQVLANEIIGKLKNQKLNNTSIFRLAEYANKINPGNYKVLEVLFDIRYNTISEKKENSDWRGKRKVKDIRAMSPDGSKFASPSGGYTINVFDAHSELILFSLPQQEQLITALTFSPDGLKIVSRSGEKTVKFWNSKTGKLLFTLTLNCFEDDIFFMNNQPDQLFCGEDNMSYGESFWVNSDNIISEMDLYNEFNIGYLNPDEINFFELEESFEYAGVYSEIDALIKQGKGKEEWLFSIADYFLSKGRKLKGNPTLCRPYFEKAISIYEALKENAKEYSSKIYQERIEATKMEMKK